MRVETLERRYLLTVLPTAGSEPSRLFAAGDAVYFSANDADHGFELWTSDGTPEGTVLVKDIIPGQQGAEPHAFASVGETVYFLAFDADRHPELWKTDGTEAGTTLVRALHDLAGATESGEVVNFNDTL